MQGHRPLGPFQPVLEPPLALLEAYGRLEAIHRAFDGAAQELEQARAAPICIEGCGRCCQVNSPYGWDIEGRYIISTVLGDGHLTRLASLAEGWLLDRPRQLTIYDMKPGRVPESLYPRLREEIQWVMNSPCPFLESDTKRCAIYRARPIGCRASGVTRLASRDCPKPLGIGETESRRAYYGGPGGMALQQQVAKFIAGLKPEWGVSWPLPTLLYSLTNPGNFNTYSENGKIANAKLVVGRLSPAIIWQSQLDKLWRQATKQQN